MQNSLVCGRFTVDLSRPVVMGILNVTPDSFSDGGEFFGLQQAEQHALEMHQQGAAIIDVGGESTRPGSQAVSLQEELDRVIPVIERLSKSLDIPVSVDTSKPEVMREAVAVGASMINDVMSLQQSNAVETVAGLDASIAICLMHMQGQPRTMQANPGYTDVVDDVIQFLMERIQACKDAGIAETQLLVDPGFGFGKTLQHNLTLLANLSRFTKINLPLLVGISRKSMIGTLLGDVTADQRLFGSVAAAVLAYERGATILRVHDVKETVDALAIADAVKNSSPGLKN